MWTPTTRPGTSVSGTKRTSQPGIRIPTNLNWERADCRCCSRSRTGFRSLRGRLIDQLGEALRPSRINLRSSANRCCLSSSVMAVGSDAKRRSMRKF